MKKLAIVFDGDIVNLKGKVNAIINRIRFLSDIADYDIDVYSIQFYDSYLSCLFKGKKYVKNKTGQIQLEGINVNVIYLKSHILDLLLTTKLKKKPIFREKQLVKLSRRFTEYDAISAHSFICSNLALIIGEKYNIPFFCTWHGSEIHSIPKGNEFQYQRMRDILTRAHCNFFVSRALAETAQKFITPVFEYEILYNGVNSSFLRYNNADRAKLREKYNVTTKKVVSFIGNLIDVKNPQLLAPIFAMVAQKYEGKVQFWVIGDGSMRSIVEAGLKAYNLDYIMWGNQPSSLMPSLYQCVDVVILISKNEGLPLTLPEAIACGANAVGSRVGGIPEVLLPENVIDHGPDFVEKMSNRVVHLLQCPQQLVLNPIFSWGKTAMIENKKYQEL